VREGTSILGTACPTTRARIASSEQTGRFPSGFKLDRPSVRLLGHDHLASTETYLFGRRGWTRTSDPQLRRLCVVHLFAMYYASHMEPKWTESCILHLALAASFALRTRSSLGSVEVPFGTRALPPFLPPSRPSATAAGFLCLTSGIFVTLFEIRASHRAIKRFTVQELFCFFHAGSTYELTHLLLPPPERFLSVSWYNARSSRVRVIHKRLTLPCTHPDLISQSRERPSQIMPANPRHRQRCRHLSQPAAHHVMLIHR
jgi:hypothetical protein